MKSSHPRTATANIGWKPICRLLCFLFFFPAECHSSCSVCMGRTPHNCTACASPQVLLDGKCLSECPEGLYRQKALCHCEYVAQRPTLRVYTAASYCLNISVQLDTLSGYRRLFSHFRRDAYGSASANEIFYRQRHTHTYMLNKQLKSALLQWIGVKIYCILLQ